MCYKIRNSIWGLIRLITLHWVIMRIKVFKCLLIFQKYKHLVGAPGKHAKNNWKRNKIFK